jgi:glycosyltransferase involved in cell wall biosynthesis
MTISPFNLLQRSMAWKAFVEQSVRSLFEQLAKVNARIDALEENNVNARIDALAENNAALRVELERLSEERRLLYQTAARMFARDAIEPLSKRISEVGALGDHYEVLLSRRASELLVLLIASGDPMRGRLGGGNPGELIGAVVEGALHNAVLILPDGAGGHVTHRTNELLEAIRKMPVEACAWAQARKPTFSNAVSAATNSATEGAPTDYFDRLEQIVADLDRLDFHALATNALDKYGRAETVYSPFDEPNLLPSYVVAAEPRRRSALFSHHSYYNFYYLARALRARGWDAMSISTEAPDSPNRPFYHGEDETIFDPDPLAHKRQIQSFLAQNAGRFGIIHSYGIDILSLFVSSCDQRLASAYPWDILEAKRRGVLVGYSHSGCLDGVSQSSFRAWSPSMCSNCVWEHRPDVCSDTRNLEWGRKLTTIVDLFCTETDPPLDFKGSSRSFRAPLTFALDSEHWHPDLKVPAHYQREGRTEEVIVFHGMGNYASRTCGGRNVKGTGAVIKAIEQLQREGINIQLDFVQNVPSKDMRYIQSQADIVVDQLNYGRYGALAREAMMLGKPVVGRVNRLDGVGLPATRCVQETPIVDADEMTVVDVLRDLALNPAKREAIGKASREHAIHWWSAERLAERFERVYDYLRAHGKPPLEEEVQ